MKCQKIIIWFLESLYIYLKFVWKINKFTMHHQTQTIGSSHWDEAKDILVKIKGLPEWSTDVWDVVQRLETQRIFHIFLHFTEKIKKEKIPTPRIIIGVEEKKLSIKSCWVIRKKKKIRRYSRRFKSWSSEPLCNYWFHSFFNI